MDALKFGHIRAGDTVVINAGSMDVPSLHEAVVTRVTATQIVVPGSRYRRSNGRACDKYSREYVVSDADIPQVMLGFRRVLTERAIRMGRYSLSRADIEKMRVRADEGEAVLRELGWWDQAP